MRLHYHLLCEMLSCRSHLVRGVLCPEQDTSLVAKCRRYYSLFNGTAWWFARRHRVHIGSLLSVMEHSKLAAVTMNNHRLRSFVEKLVTEHNSLQSQVLAAAADSQELEDSHRKHFKKLSQLSRVVHLFDDLKLTEDELLGLKELIRSLDPVNEKEMYQLAKHELSQCQEKQRNIEHQLIEELIPADDTDDINEVILELVSGAGGAEAMLFTQQMFDMYANYSAYKQWTFTVLDLATSELPGSLRHACVNISGANAYKLLKYEGGVHRVQRVPKTESSGRLHTSTMAVSVLPEPDQIQVDIKSKDLKIETCRASGPGGQNVNKSDSAVRIHHLPTGLTTESQQDRSQLNNKNIALRKLRAILFERQLQSERTKRTAERELHVGSMDRGEKIRTYNWNQDRITDHRLSENVHDIEVFMFGSEKLDAMLHKLWQKSRHEKLLRILEEETNGEKC